MLQKTIQRLRQRLRPFVANQPRFLVQHDLLQGTAAETDDRHPMRHSLDHTAPKGLLKSARRAGFNVNRRETQKRGCVLAEAPELTPPLQSRDVDLVLQCGTKLFLAFS